MIRLTVRAVAIGALSVIAPACAAQARAPVPSQAPQGQTPAVAEAAAVVDAFHAALRRGDTEAAAALLVEDALVFEEGRAERSKAEYAARHLGADAEFSKAVPGSVTVRRGAVSGDLAWIASEGRTKGRFRSTDVNRVTAETMVLRRAGEAWKIVHIHWSSKPSPVE